jgi:outer membrane receptor for ferrienterochelin and colicins
MKKSLLLISFLCLSLSGIAQSIKGYLTNDKNEPLYGATLYWEGTTLGTVADVKGWYQLFRPANAGDTLHLLVDYVGYESTMFEILAEEDTVHLSISGVANLMEVEVAAKIRDNYTSTIQTINIENIGMGELKKAACCSLADCFETNASVDVTYSNAITGTREIEMLGLRGLYTQTLMENRPMLNGIGGTHSMEYVPGTWLSGISIAKGAGSIQNGFSAITGQINAELKKPYEDYPLFVNLYAGHLGRMEANVHLNKVFSSKWSSGILLHGSTLQNEIDHNHDHYLDMPTKKTLNALYRVFYKGSQWSSQFNIQAVNDERAGGDTRDGEAYFHFQQNNKRVEAFGKLAYLGLEKTSNSIGLIYNATWHKLDDSYGDLIHQGEQRNAYAQLLYEGLIGTSGKHKFYTGASYTYDDNQELLTDSEGTFDTDNDRTEHIAGAYAEYMKCNASNVYDSFGNRIGLIVGLRADKHNLYDWLISPRLNIKYNLNENTILRFSAGRAYRTPNIYAENSYLFASSRQFIVLETPDVESANNMGLNFTKTFKAGERNGQFSIDLYRTNFDNQVVLDLDEQYNQVILYNLEGQSYSNSLLTMIQFDILKGLEMKVAYKFNDVKVDYNSGLRQKPLVARHRGLVTLDYTTPNERWAFNTSMQLIGRQRFPDNSERPDDLVKDHTGHSPAYALINGQITRKFKTLDIYIGAENLTSYKQHHPIIDGHDWQSEYFDASQIYAPIMGRMFYLGLRWWLDKK